MRRQGLVWLAATVLALGAAACFSDPTKALRNGATRLQLSQNTVTLLAGDSLSVRAYVLDDQGNQLDVGTPTWTSADPTVATVRTDAPAPGNVFTNGVVVGINNQAGVTDVTVSVQGVQGTVRVTVLPATFPGTHSVTGTAGADTFIVNRPAPLAALVFVYTVGDTLVLNATTSVTFSATSSTVAFGAFNGYIVSRTATVIKAMARQPFMGKPVVTNLTYSGSAATGPIAIASMPVDSVNIQHARFRGNIAMAASAFGANTQITVTAPAGASFTTGSSGSGIVLGANNAIVLSRTAATLTAINPANYTGSVMITGVVVGASTTDSLRTGGAATTINASTFPGTVASNTGNLLDTIIVRGNGLATFTTSGAGASVVTVNGVSTFRYRLFADSIKVIAMISGTAPVSISNVIVSGTTIPSLQTSGTVTVNTTTGEANEPGNDATATATPIVLGATAAAPDTVFGAIQSSGDVDDFFSFTTVATKNVHVVIDFVGSGSGSGTNNPDVDVLLCKNTCTLGSDFVNTAGGTAANPEVFTQAALPAGTYYIYVNGFANAATPVTYRIRANFQ